MFRKQPAFRCVQSLDSIGVIPNKLNTPMTASVRFVDEIKEWKRFRQILQISNEKKTQQCRLFRSADFGQAASFEFVRWKVVIEANGGANHPLSCLVWQWLLPGISLDAGSLSAEIGILLANPLFLRMCPPSSPLTAESSMHFGNRRKLDSHSAVNHTNWLNLLRFKACPAPLTHRLAWRLQRPNQNVGI